MWYVKGEFRGRIAWWSGYKTQEDAEKVAKLVNGTVISETEFQSMKLP